MNKRNSSTRGIKIMTGTTGNSTTGRSSPINHHLLNNSISPKERNISGGLGGNRSHGYCLKWKYHPNNLLHMFNQLLLNESFTDVVIACEGKIIKCHKMVLSACSKYFEQVFCEYPQQSSTLVILKDYSYNDVQAIIEFMYQGEINVAHDRLQSLLKAAESLQVKGLADITGNDGNGSGTAVNPSGLSRDEAEFATLHSGEDSNPNSPLPLDGKHDAGGSSESRGSRRKRGRPPMNSHDQSSMDGGLINLSTHPGNDDHQFDDFPVTNMLETQYTNPRSSSKKFRKKGGGSSSQTIDLSMTSGTLEPHDEDMGSDDLGNDDDDVTEEDIQSIVKMTDYIEKGGSRPQFWDEPLTKKVMNAIKNKKMEMKAAAEVLGVSYSTLYSRYRELYGYLKMPANQDTNVNYYQVLNLLRAGQISLQDAAKRLNINERTLTAYLSTTITPKRPKTVKPGGSSLIIPDSKAYGFGSGQQGQNAEDLSHQSALNLLGNPNFDEDGDNEDEDSDGSVKNLHLASTVKSEMDEGVWGVAR